MRKRFRATISALLIVALCASCAQHGRQSEEPSRLSASRTEAPESSIDYGEEVYRQVSKEDEIVSTLRNGLVVIVKRVPSPVCAVRAYALTGGVYEGKWLGGGLSHLLEHLVAGGTNGRRTEEQNRNLLQSIGNNSNAYTDYDHTAFFVNSTTEHMEKAVDLVAGWMFTAAITPAEYRREYEVVQRELEKDKGSPDDVFSELTFDNRYRVSPAHVPVIGYQEVIQSLSRDDVYSYYKQTYQPNNMVFAVAGNLPPEQMLKAVQRNVRDYKPGRAFSRDIAQEPELTGPRTAVATFPRLGAARLELAFPSVKLDHDDVYALDLLAAVLGNGESSIMTQELRDKQQLVDSVAVSDFTPSYVEGTFAIDLVLDAAKIKPATTATLEIIERIKHQGVDDKSLTRAKTQMRVAQIKSRQTTEEIISQMAIDYISAGDPHFSDRYLERIDKITSAQLQEVAKKYLVTSKLLTTALLAAESSGASGLPTAEALLRAAAPTTAPATRASEPSRITRLQLENGVVLLHRSIPTSPLVQIRMYALGGVTAEDDATNGLGDVTMDAAMRGTKSHDGGQIAELLDAMGAAIDTDCTSNTWSWSASCLKGDLAKTADLFVELVSGPTFPEDEVAAVKQRALAEIEAQDADWLQQGLRFFKAQYFGPMHSPYRFLAIGTSENVKRFTPEQMRSWYAQKVLNGPRVIAIFGDVGLDQAKAIVARLPAAPAPSKSRSRANDIAGKPYGKPSIDVMRFEIQKTEQPLAGVFIGFKSDSTFGSQQRFALDVADCMCSGYEGPTGYLFDVLRGRGLVYQTDAQDLPGLNDKLPGTFMAFAGCDPSKVNEVIDLMLLNLARLQGSERDVQRDWFDRSKQLITTQDAMDHESPDAQASSAALDELYGLGYDAHEHFADQINAVKLEQVRTLAQRALNQCVITVSTPRPELVNRQTGVRKYDSFPAVDLTPRGVQHDTGGGAVK